MKILYLPVIAILVSCLSGAVCERHRWGSHFRSSQLGVINGKNASIENFPYMVSFYIEDEFLGSGVILNKHWILTTAFIVGWETTSNIKIRAGSDKYDDGGEILKAQKVVIPDSYTGSWEWDIGLVKVKKAIKFSDTIKSVKLGSGELNNGTKATIVGWGAIDDDSYTASETLMSAKLTVLDRKTCSSYYTISSRIICTFDKKAGASTFDFGDPLILKGRVYGLFAGAEDYTPGDGPMVYTNVLKFNKWIKKNIKS